MLLNFNYGLIALIDCLLIATLIGKQSSLYEKEDGKKDREKIHDDVSASRARFEMKIVCRPCRLDNVNGALKKYNDECYYACYIQAKEK